MEELSESEVTKTVDINTFITSEVCKTMLEAIDSNETPEGLKEFYIGILCKYENEIFEILMGNGELV